MEKKPKRKKLNQLGELEADVMGVVWEKGRTTIQDVGAVS
jgi:predicted transcriptional regulator